MTSFNNFSHSIDILNKNLSDLTYIPLLTRLTLPERTTVLENQPNDTIVNVKFYSVDEIKQGFTSITHDNNNIKKLSIYQDSFTHKHWRFEAAIQAPVLQQVSLEYFMEGGNAGIYHLSREWDKIGCLGYGNQGLYTGVEVRDVTGVTDGKTLCDAIITLATEHNNRLARGTPNRAVKIVLTGNYAVIWSVNRFSDFQNLNDVIPSWIQIELNANLDILNELTNGDTKNTITVVSPFDIRLYRGKLPQFTTGIRTKEDVSIDIQYARIGCDSVSVQKEGGVNAVSFYKEKITDVQPPLGKATSNTTSKATTGKTTNEAISEATNNVK